MKMAWQPAVVPEPSPPVEFQALTVCGANELAIVILEFTIDKSLADAGTQGAAFQW